jgi:hypothetical protein
MNFFLCCKTFDFSLDNPASARNKSRVCLIDSWLVSGSNGEIMTMQKIETTKNAKIITIARPTEI